MQSITHSRAPCTAADHCSLRGSSCPYTINRVQISQFCTSKSACLRPDTQQLQTLRVQQTRLQAMPVAEVAQLGEVVGEALGVIGIAAGGVFVALWNVEKESKSRLEQELQEAKGQLGTVQQEVLQLQQQLESERQARKEAESWKPRLDDSQKELFKLERALEMKDAQLATFMTTAHRQIKSLEDSVKELQKM